MKFRPTEFLNTPYRVSWYIKLYRKLFSCMRPIETSTLFKCRTIVVTGQLPPRTITPKFNYPSHFSVVGILEMVEKPSLPGISKVCYYLENIIFLKWGINHGEIPHAG